MFVEEKVGAQSARIRFFDMLQALGRSSIRVEGEPLTSANRHPINEPVKTFIVDIYSTETYVQYAASMPVMTCSTRLP